jgi:hypothetical protein
MSPSKNDADLVAKSDSGLDPVLPERRMRPVLWWASLGVAAVAIQAYIYTRWFFSDSFRAVGTGTDPAPTYDKVFAWILQPAFGLAALLAAAWFIRGCLKERRMTFDAKIYLGWISMIWLDHAANLIRPQMLFNSYYLNRGLWDEYIHWVHLPQSPEPPSPVRHRVRHLLFSARLPSDNARQRRSVSTLHIGVRHNLCRRMRSR